MTFAREAAGKKLANCCTLGHSPHFYAKGGLSRKCQENVCKEKITFRRGKHDACFGEANLLKMKDACFGEAMTTVGANMMFVKKRSPYLYAKGGKGG
jgi:hypothetical protein